MNASILITFLVRLLKEGLVTVQIHISYILKDKDKTNRLTFKRRTVTKTFSWKIISR